MAKPLVALSARRWLGETISGLPANFATLGVDLSIGGYADATNIAGGTAVVLPCTPASVDVLDRVDALVLSGGSDVSPLRYAASVHPEVYGIDDLRDEVEISLANRALELGMPVLAICRGLQVLNVARGGTLVQHLDASSGDSHANWDIPASTLVHEASFVAGSLAHQVYGAATKVNSLHHQALGRVGEGIIATGWSADGTIEAAEMPGRPVFGVQFHPELVDAQPDPAFSWLVETARR